jgi:hypothetical protein
MSQLVTNLMHVVCAVGILFCFLPVLLGRNLYCPSCTGDDFPLAKTLKNSMLEKCLILGVGICIPIFVDLVQETCVSGRRKTSTLLLINWNIWLAIALPFITLVFVVIPFSYFELVPSLLTSSYILMDHAITYSAMIADADQVTSRLMPLCFLCGVIAHILLAWTAFVNSSFLESIYLVFTVLCYTIFVGLAATWARRVMTTKYGHMSIEDYMCSIQYIYGILFVLEVCIAKFGFRVGNDWYLRDQQWFTVILVQYMIYFFVYVLEKSALQRIQVSIVVIV